MKNRHKQLILAIAVAAAPSFAQASGWYGSLGVGYSDADTDVTPLGSNLAVDPGFPKDWAADSATSFSIGLGYQLNDRFRLEVRYSSRDVKTDDVHIGTGDRNGFDYNVQFETDLPAWTLEGFYDFRAGKTVRPFLKAGVGLSSTESEATIGSDADPLFTMILGPAGFLDAEGRYPYAEESSDNFAWLIGVGIRWDLSERIDLTLEFQRLNVGDVATSEDAFTDSFGADNLGLNEANFGINIHF